MITVDVKIDLFSKMVREKGISKDLETLKLLNKKYDKVLKETESKFEEERKIYLGEMKNKAIEDRYKLLSKTESENQKCILIKKNELFNKFKEDLISAIEDFTFTEDYKRIFLDKFNNAIADFIESDDILIGVKARDLNFIPAEMKTLIDEKIIGGFYFIKNERIKYDYTLNSELNMIDNFLGCMINDLFEQREEVENEE